MTIPEAVLSSLSDRVARRTGLHFPRDRWHELEQRLAAAARALEFPDTAACAQWYVSGRSGTAQEEVLLGHLVTGETYFFREPASLAYLESEVLGELIRVRRESSRCIRIWSAGCATGEEPYSIAMLVDRLLGGGRGWNVSILATDVNPSFLRHAEAGVYSRWSFRAAPHWILRDCFTRRAHGRFELVPRIRRMVRFASLNLATDDYPLPANDTRAMDVILCRNVLMYFAAPRVEQVLARLHAALADGGWLGVAPVEYSFVPASFEAVRYEGGVFHRKRNGSAAPRPAYADIAPPRAVVTMAPPLTPEPAPGGSAIAPAQAPAADVDAVVARARVLHQDGLHEEAVQELLGARLDSAPNLEVATLLARAYANLGRLEDARAWCGKGIAMSRIDPVCHYLLATVLQEQGAPDAADAALRRVLFLEPRFVLAHVALGNLARAQERSREARRHYANALDCLAGAAPDAPVAEGDGMTAGQLAGMIRAVAAMEGAR